MSERIHVLAQQILGKSSVEECDLQDLKNLVHRFPYFAPGQFLLLEKLRQISSPEYSSQLQKAVLYYHNPLEFEYFLSSDKFYKEIETASSQEPGTVVEEVIITEELDTIETESDTGNIQASTSAWGVELHEKEEQQPQVPQDPLNLLEKKLQQIRQHNPVDETGLMENEDLSTLKSQLSKHVTSSELTFEPFHTVDYFASQGIRLSQEEAGTDKFGKQLKSFTEWLKTMKRIPAPEVLNQVETPTEKKVQHLAEDSVHEADVVTEVMAEVWLKQGNTAKAIEVYNKLGLLNPSKLAYFAAKIDNLKSS